MPSVINPLPLSVTSSLSPSTFLDLIGHDHVMPRSPICSTQIFLRFTQVRTKSYLSYTTITTMLSAALKQGLRRSTATLTTRRGFAKEIKFGVEGRAAMLKGVETLADAVQVCANKDERRAGLNFHRT